MPCHTCRTVCAWPCLLHHAYGVPLVLQRAELMERAGFVAPEVELLRKRNSKKELFEFVVHARG